MLDQTDIDRVSSYIYEGFPELKGRVAVRRFNPPSLDAIPIEELDQHLKEWDSILRRDFVSQFSPEARQAAAHVLDIHLSGGRKIKTLLRPTASCASLLTITTDPENHIMTVGPSGYYYITQEALPSRRNLWLYENSATRVPVGYAHTSSIFTLAHEFMHAARSLSKSKGLQSTQREEAGCDVVAAACVLALRGYESKHALSIIRDYRLAKGKDIHDTGLMLLHTLGDKGFTTTGMGAKEALQYAKRLYDCMYPSENTIKIEPAPAL